MKRNQMAGSIVVIIIVLIVGGYNSLSSSNNLPKSHTTKNSYFVSVYKNSSKINIINNTTQSLVGTGSFVNVNSKGIAPNTVTMPWKHNTVIIAVGHVNDPGNNHVYLYDGTTGKYKLEATLPSISGWTFANGLVWVVEDTKHKYRLVSYSPDSWKRVGAFRINGYPSFICFNATNGYFYTLTSKGTPRSQSTTIEARDEQGDLVYKTNLPKNWVYGGMTIGTGSIYVSQTEMVPIKADGTQSSQTGNKVIILSSKLKKKGSVTINGAPGLLSTSNHTLWILSSTRGTSQAEVLSYKINGINVTHLINYPLQQSVTHMGVLDNTGAIYMVGNNNVLTIIGHHGEPSNIDLGGESFNQWIFN